VLYSFYIFDRHSESALLLSTMPHFPAQLSTRR
jgi:hypothetical protein